MPNIIDNVFFDQNSFSSNGSVVSINSAANCSSMDWTGCNKTVIVSGSAPLKIYGSIKLSSSITAINMPNVYFSGSSIGNTLDFAGVQFNSASVYFEGQGSWSLLSDFKTTGYIRLEQGSLNTTGHRLEGYSFLSNAAGSSVRNLNISGSTVVLNTSFEVVNGSPGFTFIATSSIIQLKFGNVYTRGLTFNNLILGDSLSLFTNNVVVGENTFNSISFLRSGTIYGNITASSITSADQLSFYYDFGYPTNPTQITGGKIISSVNTGGNITIQRVDTNTIFRKVVAGGNGLIYGDNYIDTLVLSSGKTYTFNFKQHIHSLVANGTCAEPITIRSTNAGSIALFNFYDQNINVSYCDFKDISVDSASTIIASYSVDEGNNSRISFINSTSNTYYWIAGSGNWIDPAHWSLSSGGPVSGCIPTAIDNAIFDSNSFTSNGSTINFSADVKCNDVDFSQINHTVSFFGSYAFSIFGSLKLSSFLIFDPSIATFTGHQSPKTIAMNGGVFNCDVEFADTAVWSISDSLNIGFGNTLYFHKGTINSNNKNISFYSAQVAPQDKVMLNFGTSKINCTSTFYIQGIFGTIVDLDSATIVLSKSPSILSAYSTRLYDFLSPPLRIRSLIAENNCDLYGTLTVDTVNYFTNKNVLSSGVFVKAQKIYVKGDCGTYVSLLGGTYNSVQATDTLYIENARLQNVNTSMGVATNSINLGGSSNWIYRTNSPSIYWVGGSGNWSDNMHWSTTSGGSGGTCIPNSINDVVFDANSFTNPLDSNVVTLNQAASCNNMNWTGVINSPKLSGSTDLNISGSLTLSPTMLSMHNGRTNFVTASTSTINSAGMNFKGNVAFTGTGSWSLSSSFTCDSTITFNRGTLNTNNQIVSCRTFVSSNSFPRLLTLGSSVLNVTDLWDMTDSTSLTVSGAASTINMSGSAPVFIGGGKQYLNLNFTSPTSNASVIGKRNNVTNLHMYGSGSILGFARVSNLTVDQDCQLDYSYFHTYDPSDVSIYGRVIIGNDFTTGATYGDNSVFQYLQINGNGTIYTSNVIDTLKLKAAKAYKFQAGKQQTIKDVIATGNCNDQIIIRSSSPALTTSFVKSSGSVVITGCVIDNVVASGANFTANNSAAVNTTTGWNIVPLAARNLYWIGGSGNWNDAAHWSTTSGGLSTGCIPTINDNVFFDAQSFSGNNEVVELITDAYCHDMDWSDAQFVPSIHSLSSRTITISGYLKLIPDMSWNVSGEVNFSSKLASTPLTFSGKVFLNTVTFNGEGWTLNDSLTTDTSASVYLYKGSIDLSGTNTNVGSFYTGTTNSVELLHSGNFTVSKNWNAYNIQPGSISHLTLTGLNSGVDCVQGFDFSTITFANGSSLAYQQLTLRGNHTVDRVDFNSNSIVGAGQTGTTQIRRLEANGDATFASTLVCDTFVAYAGHQYRFTPSFTSTFGIIDNMGGDCSNVIALKSISPGVSVNISALSDTLRVRYAQLTDINSSGPKLHYANSSIDNGNNTGWFFNTEVSQGSTLYWVGGSGNWNDPAHWSSVSGGTGGGCVPGATDDVVFDENSFSTLYQQVFVTNAATCHNMTWANVHYAPDLAGYYELQISGSIVLNDSMTVSLSQALRFVSSSVETLDLSASSFNAPIVFDGTGSWTFIDSLNSNQQIDHYQGSVNTNGFTIRCYTFISDNSNVRSLNIDNSSIYVYNYWFLSITTGLTLSTTNSTINLQYEYSAFYGGNQIYNRVNFINNSLWGSSSINDRSQFNSILSNGPLSIFDAITVDTLLANSSLSIVSFSGGTPGANEYGTVTVTGDFMTNGYTAYPHFERLHLLGHGTFRIPSAIDTLDLSPGRTYMFGDGVMQTINVLNANGNCSGLINIKSASNGFAAYISGITASNTLSYVSLQDIHIQGSPLFSAINSIDLGGNDNILLSQLTGTNLYWVGGDGNWNDNSHWSTTSGGPGGACVPNPYDDVFFDVNSFVSSNNVVNVNADALCHNMDWTGTQFNPTVSGSTISVYGSLILDSHIAGIQAPFYFKSDSIGNTIQTNGVAMADIEFSGLGDYTLTDNLSADFLTLTSGGLNAAGRTLNVIAFNSTSPNTRDLSLYGSTVNIRSALYFAEGSHLNLNAAHSTINLIDPAAYIQLSDYFYSLGDINILGGWSSIYCMMDLSVHKIHDISGTTNYITANLYADSVIMEGPLYLNSAFAGSLFSHIDVFYVGGEFSNSAFMHVDKLTLMENSSFLSPSTVDNLVLNAGYTCSVFPGYTQNWDHIQTNGTCASSVTIRSYFPATQAQISLAGNTDIYQAQIKDIEITHGTLNAYGSVDLGNNSGVNIVSVSPEVCGDGIDNNCDGLIDENCASAPHLTIEAFIQGFYEGASHQFSALNTLYSSNYSDSVIVEIRNNSSPFYLVYSEKVVMRVNGQIDLNPSNIISGSTYYIVLRHRNAIETWSASPILISQNTTYSFATSANQAYGNNLAQMPDGKFAIYSGDVNQDGVIDMTDLSLVESDCTIPSVSYRETDLTGDNVVESTDYSLLENNIAQSVHVQKP
ncbi:MAG: hypothetical protein IPP51_05415 [Bacteroidetes bacterium]|nr:hypothetical protein [Bacteroidota bacterium]